MSELDLYVNTFWCPSAPRTERSLLLGVSVPVNIQCILFYRGLSPRRSYPGLLTYSTVSNLMTANTSHSCMVLRNYWIA